MRVYLLDTNVLSYFLHAGQKKALALIATRMPLALVDEVHQEMLKDTKRGAEYRKWQPSTGIVVRTLSVGSVGATCLGKLRKKSGDSKNLGEYASIALAVDDPGLVFVTNDQKGAWLAQRELVAEGERVLGFWAFLHRAQAATNMSRTVAETVARVALVDHEPTWWADWLATLPP